MWGSEMTEHPLVPLADPLRFLPGEEAAVRAAIDDVLDGGPLILGDHVETFEQSFGHYLDASNPPEVIGVGNGMDALTLSLIALDLPAGAKVLVTASDGGFAAGAVRAAGHQPVVVDVEPNTHLVSAQTLARADNGRCQAVILTHLHGQAVSLDAFDWARARGLAIVEDVAQAHGGTLGETRLGLLGDLASFSFYPTKNLGAMGDGGAVATRDQTLAGRLRVLRQYGWGERLRVTMAGGRNSRLDALQAAVLTARLPWLDQHNARRRQVVGHYRAALGGDVLVLGDAEGAVAHHAVVVHPQRESLRHHLIERAVGVDVHYPWLVQEMPGLGLEASDTPGARVARDHKLSLPCFGGITDAEIERVCGALREWGCEHA